MIDRVRFQQQGSWLLELKNWSLLLLLLLLLWYRKSALNQ
jgi:hypothetical protein